MSDANTLYENLKITKLEKSTVEAEADIPAAILEKERPKVLRELNESANLSGFRPGKIPEKVIIEKFGDIRILEEAADKLFPEIVYDIFSKNIPNAIGRPTISITKIAKGEPLHFKIKTAVLPDIKLPDYTAIAKEKNNEKEEVVIVEDSEVEKVLEEMQHAVAHREKKDIKDVLIDDAFVKKIGDFKDLADLKEKVKQNITAEKTMRNAEKKRISLLEGILDKTSVELPEVMVTSELERINARFEEDITKMGLKPDDYLSHIKKTREDLRNEWRPQAEKNAKLDLILASIAKEEKLMPEAAAVDQETNHILSHHKDADKDSVRSYVTMVLTHQKVFEFLEKQK